MDMLVDSLLRWIGENPAAYGTTADKWIELYVFILINFIFPYLPFFLGVLPWLLLVWKKIKKQIVSQRLLLVVFFLSLLLVVVGIYLPDLYVYLLAGLALREL